MTATGRPRLPKPMKMDRETGTWAPDPDVQGCYEVELARPVLAWRP